MYLQPTQSWVDDILWTEDWRCLDRMSGQPDSAEGCREEVGYNAQALKVKTKLSLHWLNIPISVLSSLSSLHSFVLHLVHCWTLSTKFPSNHSKQIIFKKNPNKRANLNNFFWLLLYQLWISKQRSTAQKPLQDNSLEVFQKHMISYSILIPLVCGILAFGTIPLIGYFYCSSFSTH